MRAHTSQSDSKRPQISSRAVRCLGPDEAAVQRRVDELSEWRGEPVDRDALPDTWIVVADLVDDAREDLADGVPADPRQAGDRGLGHLLGEERDEDFEVAGVDQRDANGDAVTGEPDLASRST